MRMTPDQIVEAVIREMGRSDIGVSVKDWEAHVRIRRNNAADVVRMALDAAQSADETWRSCGHIAWGTCSTCYVERGQRLSATETKLAQAAQRVAELEAALRPFSRRAAYFENKLKANGGDWQDDDGYVDEPPSAIYLKELRAARAALGKEKSR